ncbi:NUDIX domain-containing protein [Betaproteobacteria bacterium LSUCC0115]|nr:NUDIX domain-containing protein [Burkholderiales bacterium LSUCC0115]
MSDSADWVQVAVGVVRDADGRILMTSRPLPKVYAGWWEFPGGKLEAGETVEEALVRELSEELGLELLVSDISRLWSTEHVYAHASVRLHFCLVDPGHSPKTQDLTGGAVASRLTMREGQQACWLDFSLGQGRPSVPYPVLPASQPIIERLQVTQGHLKTEITFNG